MPSPFPGMDPYMELHWRDVHAALVATTRAVLNGQLPTGLVARVEERVTIDALEGPVRAYVPDVQVVEDRSDEKARGTTTAAVAVASPVVLQVESYTETYITVLESAGERLVTVIEFLSPSNKRGDSMADYLTKRGELLSGGVNLVEVDLVRKGSWVKLIAPNVPPPQLATPYRVVTRRHGKPSQAELFPITLRQRLPIIPIPLREMDQDATLDLQAILTRAYDEGRYAGTDYRQPLDPPLEGEDATWADELLKTAGRR